MAKLEDIGKVYKILGEYNGTNPFILKLKKAISGDNPKSLNSYEMEYILTNHDKEPVFINKIVKVADFWGEKQKEKYGFEFVPEKVKMTWFLGETESTYHFYCIFRRSQTKATEVFAMKRSILTDFRADAWKNTQIDFQKYNEKSGITLYPHQEDAVKFLVAQKKAILADAMGFGKTKSAIVAALEAGCKHILIICPASLKQNWKKELLSYVSEDEITIVEGSTWKENKFTIINYDILKNFYEVPTTTAKKRGIELNDSGKIVCTEKEVEVVSKKASDIAKAMSNSQLYQSNFDHIIIDEAHRLSNTSSGIFKIVSDLVKRSKPTCIYEMTGTPITNKPINFFNLLKIIDAPIAKDWQYYVERYCDGKQIFDKKEKKAYTAIFMREHEIWSYRDMTEEINTKLIEYLEQHCKKIWITGGASYLEELQEVIKPYYIRRDKTDLNMVKKEVKLLKYNLTPDERKEYDQVWDEFMKDKQGLDEYKRLLEGSAFRQWLANKMVWRTVRVVRKLLSRGEKVIIFCTFDEELYALEKEFHDICVIHNGKILPKKKNENVEKFQNDENCKVFIGNIISAGVGLTLTASSVVVFNSIDYVPGNVEQAEDRIHRLNQTKDCTVFYQVFNDTYMEKMFDIIHSKSKVINTIIISEKEK